MIRALTEAGARALTARVAVAAAVVSTVYGVTDELHQSLVPTRQSDALDVLADAIGASVAAGALLVRSHGIEAARRPASDAGDGPKA